MLNILLVSNSPKTPTGYGTETNRVYRAMVAAGYKVTLFPYYGQEGAPSQDENGVVFLPRLQDPWGSDIVRGHADFAEADIVITLNDAWALDPVAYGALNWCAWTPIDGDGIFTPYREVLPSAKWIWAMSKHGKRQLEAAGFHNVVYMPLSVDTEVFKPGDRKLAREKVGKVLQADLTGKFLVVNTSANKGAPPRKGYYELFSAFKEFSEDEPDALLYMHTDRQGTWGVDLDEVVALVDLDPRKVLWVPQYRYVSGMVPPAYLNDVYNAADVMLHPAHGEGFGLPIIEAQASGCPVIATDCTSMSEITAGWLVPGTPFMHMPGQVWTIPRIDELVDCLHHAYRWRDEDAERQKARDKATGYDIRRVFAEQMQPALQQIEGEINHRKAIEAGREDRKAQRIALRRTVQQPEVRIVPVAAELSA